ncbi:hypothetical protein DFH08DRAFT_956314 [Mycena albidolilacea]|uniref:Uncharacterized protein n=1 Tax=Mycena albidolilacea TaxID=1033008 RepID=A0AAD7AAA3_9AGAR|nr:hypothetical protein DFH08DRAFT_956314 [Mycena albidolilacea]
MSSATWRSVFTSYNNYRARRAQLVQENQRLAAEKRGLTALRYQNWENGEGGVQTMLVPELAKDPKQGSAAV